MPTIDLMSLQAKRIAATAFVLVACTSAPALGAVTLRYAAEGPEGSPLIIEADNAGNIRAEFGNGEAIIIRNGETYLVVPDGHEQAAVPLDVAIAVSAEGGLRMGLPTARADFRLVRHGPQSIGVWEGMRYSLEVTRPGGEPVEIVVSNDVALSAPAQAFARVRQLQARIFDAYRSRFSNYEVLARSLFEQGLMLRISRCSRLESLTNEAIMPSRFAPPARVITREQYRAWLAREPRSAPCS